MCSHVGHIEQIVEPSYHRPPRLSTLAAGAVARCLTYEDYDECNHYRWDPVMIWQYELPQRKKRSKKSAERSHLYNSNDVSMPVPQPPWKELKKFRDWWWNTSILGRLDSLLRCQIVDAFEQLSWTCNTEEEYVLFLLLRLCVDIRIEVGGERFEISSEWCYDLAQIIKELGPYPLQKLSITYDALGIKPVLTALIQQSPGLQVLRVNQWALSNDFMLSLGSHCNMLTEFAIPHMQPEVYMTDKAFFSCFFNGMTGEEVMSCWKEGLKPRLSFKHLKYIDILYWAQTEKFIQMMCVFYPSVRFCGIDAYNVGETKSSLAQPFVDVGSQVTAMRVSCKTKGILDERLTCVVNRAPYLREIRYHVDDNFEGADDTIYESKLDEAGSKLKKLVTQINAFEALALRPHEGVDICRVVMPTLLAQGSCITSLQFCFEFANLNSNTLFQILNLCPRLHRLTVSMNLGETDEASSCNRTKLNPSVTLHTLVVHDIPLKSDEMSVNGPGFTEVTGQLLKAAPNLEMLGLSCSLDMEDDFSTLSSRSVETLHLQFCSEVERDSTLQCFLHHVLPNFPNLKTLSLEEEEDGSFDVITLTALCRTGVNITRRKPEFFHLPKWDSSCSSHNSFALYVM